MYDKRKKENLLSPPFRIAFQLELFYKILLFAIPVILFIFLIFSIGLSLALLSLFIMLFLACFVLFIISELLNNSGCAIDEKQLELKRKFFNIFEKYKIYRFDAIHDVYYTSFFGVNTVVFTFDNGQSPLNQSIFSHSYKKVVLRHVYNPKQVCSYLLKIVVNTKNNMDVFSEIIDKAH